MCTIANTLVFLHILLCTETHTITTFLEIDNNDNNLILQCITALTAQFTNMYIIFSEQTDYLLLKQLSTSIIPKIVLNSNATNMTLQNDKGVNIILLSDDIEYLQQFSEQNLYNRANIIVCNDNISIEAIYNLVVWKNLMLKTILVDAHGDVYTRVTLQEHCIKNKSHNLLGSCQNVNLNEASAAFEDISTYDDCEITIYAFPGNFYPYLYTTKNGSLDGIDAKLLNVLSRVHKFVIAMTNDSENGDMGVGSLSNAHDDASYFSYTYSTGNLALLVPIAQEISARYALSHVYQGFVWIALIMTLLIVFVVVHLISKIAAKKVAFLNCLALYGMLISQQVIKPNGAIHRWMFMMWCMFSFVITSSYLSLFLSHLIKPVYEEQIDSIKDIAEHGLELALYSKKIAEGVFKYDLEHPDYKAIYDRYVYCSLEDVLSYIYNYRNAVTILGERSMLASPFANKYHGVHFSKQQIAVYVKGHPLKDGMDSSIHMMLAAGLVQKWEKDYVFTRKADRVGPKAIKMDQLALIFFVYVLGTVVAGVVFCYECWSGAVRKKENVKHFIRRDYNI